METGERRSSREAGKLTDDDMQIIGGRQDQLVGRVQQRYGIVKEAATKEVDAFLKQLNAQFAICS
jgi:uncharacterized protein YjbJ (UPF0337 family)